MAITVSTIKISCAQTACTCTRLDHDCNDAGDVDDVSIMVLSEANTKLFFVIHVYFAL